MSQVWMLDDNDIGLSLSTSWIVALHAEFDHYLDTQVPLPSVTLQQYWINN